MTLERDLFTSTVDGAAAHAAQYEDHYDPAEDRPDLADVAGILDGFGRPVQLCYERQTSKDGKRFRVCGLAAHGPEVRHEAHPQVHNVDDWTEPF